MDDAVVRRAERYARARGTSVSHLVERFLDLLAGGSRSGRPEEAAAPPVLRRLRGSLKGVTRADYLAHIERKHR